jgi:hypothetical protein
LSRPHDATAHQLAHFTSVLTNANLTGHAFGEIRGKRAVRRTAYCARSEAQWLAPRCAKLGLWGAAALVGRNAVLTASHVVPWNSGGNWKALFVPAYYDGASVYGANAALMGDERTRLQGPRLATADR